MTLKDESMQVYPWGEILWLHEPSSGSISAARVTLYAGQRQEAHSHPGEEQLITIVSGRGTFIVNGCEKPVEPEDFSYIPPFAVHEVLCSEDAPLVFHVIYVPLKISNSVSTALVMEPIKLTDHISIDTLSQLCAQLKTLTGLEVFILDESGKAITPHSAGTDGSIHLRMPITAGDSKIGMLVTEAIDPSVIRSRLVVIKEHLATMADYIRVRIENQMGEREKERLKEALKSLREKNSVFSSHQENTAYPVELERMLVKYVEKGEGELSWLMTYVDHVLSWRTDCEEKVRELLVVLVRLRSDTDEALVALRELYLQVPATVELLKDFLLETQQSTQALPLIEKVNRYIEQHYSEPLSLKGIAEVFYVSPNHLSTQFNQYNGTSLSLYIQRVRIDAAVVLLRGTSLKVSDIGRQVGFSSDSYFVSAFRTVKGVTPSAYRAIPRE